MQFDYSFPANFKRSILRRRSADNNEKNLPPALWIALLVTTMILLLILQILMSPKPPVRSINEGYRAFSEARAARADLYAPQLFKQTEQKWDSVFVLWRQENKTWEVSRNYSKVLEFASLTRHFGELAKSQSLQKQDSLRSAIHVATLLLEQKIADFKSEYALLPIDKNLLRRFSEGALLLNESCEAAKNENYLQAVSAIKLAEIKFGGVDEQIDQFLSIYLRQLPIWRRWADETIEWSKEHQESVILVSKLNRRLQVYTNGQMAAEFSVEFGPNWLGTKKYGGDGATPEGKYSIIKKKEKQLTRYYLALEIDYPNEHDKEEFARLQQNGLLGQNAQIGGLIEIHGEGGSGINWTDGCIALRNKDMERVYQLAQAGTPVTIVGSLNGAKKQNNSSSKKE
jgi:hypothetical protein